MKKYATITSAVFMFIIIFIITTPAFSQSSEAIIRIIAEPQNGSTDEQNVKPDITPVQQNRVTSGKSQADDKVSDNFSPVKPASPGNISQMDIPAPLSGDMVILESGINAYNSGDFNMAIEKFEELQSLFPSSPFIMQAKLYLARSFYKTNNREKALENIKSMGRNSGEYPAALYLQGEIYLSLKQRSEAKNSFFQATSLFPGHDLADNSLLQLSRIYLAEGNGEEALKIAVKLLSSYPDRDTSDDAFYMIGKIYEKDSRLKDIERARIIYTNFIKRAEVEKRAPYHKSPLLGKVKRDLDFINRNYFVVN